MSDISIDYEDKAMQAALILQGIHRVIRMALSATSIQIQGELLTVAESADAHAHFVLTDNNIEEVCHG